jgi:hypothetical protein
MREPIELLLEHIATCRGGVAMGGRQESGSDWTSLEVAKLIVPVIASAILAYVGFRIEEQISSFNNIADRNQKTIEHNQKVFDSVIQKRISLYDDIGRRLNQMFAYYMYIGKWKELSPVDITKSKRELDETIFTYRPFFSNKFINLYLSLENEMFESFQGWGKDASLRTAMTHRPETYSPSNNGGGNNWNSAWADRFTGENNTTAIRETYSKLISELPKELEIRDLSETGTQDIGEGQLPNSHAPPLVQ